MGQSLREEKGPMAIFWGVAVFQHADITEASPDMVSRRGNAQENCE